MLSHECAGIAQAGGLGEAVAGLAKTLVRDYGMKVSIFLPSHGRHLDSNVREAYGFNEISTFIASGDRIGTNGVRYGFLSGMEHGSFDGIDFFLVKGVDSQTSRSLNDPVLYDHELTFEKMALFSRTMKAYSEFLKSTNQTLPDLIHAHDWHMVPAGVAVKQNLQERGVTVPLVFTIHLLSHMTLPWHYASEEWCGIRDLPRAQSLRRKRESRLSLHQVWEKKCNNSLERFGCYNADYVTSVSQSYLSLDVTDYVGGGVLRGKSGYVYNGCDWDYDQIRSNALSQLPNPAVQTAGQSHMDRWELRKFVLTTGISQVSPDDGKMERGAFQIDGPLVLTTGRLSPQKGVDILLEAVPSVMRAIPDVRFLLFLLPGDPGMLSTIQTKAAAYPDNVRLILDRIPSLYLMSHLAADVYAMPSRSEPFGISALEAMITGNPVIGSSVGGIQETVLDLLTHGDAGTGLLVPPEDPRRLAESLISLLTVLKIDELIRQGNHDSLELASKVPLSQLADMLKQDPLLGSRIRSNCRARVEQDFRWRNAGKAALTRYKTATRLQISN